MAEWIEKPLGDLCDPSRGITYGIVKVGEFVPDGVPVIRGGDIRDNRIVFHNEKRVTQEVSAQFSRTILRGGELLINLIAEPGHSAIVPPEMVGFNVSRDVAVIPLVDSVSHGYVNWFLKSPAAVEWLAARLSGSVTQKINLGVLREVPVPIPHRQYQDRLASVLGALDDKIATNERIATTARALGLTEYTQAVGSGDAVETRLGALVSVLTRGVAPKYSADPDELTVLNQKCVRDGRVTLAPARKTLGERVSTAKRLVPHDVLVNSTGVGTLGRVARWTSDEEATVDSHVSIVRLDPEKVDLTCGGFALLRAQPEIETMGVGSTGQTELRRAQLEDLELLLPAVSRQPSLRARLDALEIRSDAALAESATLAALRDTLLPQLMSGKLRVRDAERIVEDAV